MGKDKPSLRFHPNTIFDTYPLLSVPHQESLEAKWCSHSSFVPEGKHWEVIVCGPGPPALPWLSAPCFPGSGLAWAPCALSPTNDPLGKANCTEAIFSEPEERLQLPVHSLWHATCVTSSVLTFAHLQKPFHLRFQYQRSLQSRAW